MHRTVANMPLGRGCGSTEIARGIYFGRGGVSADGTVPLRAGMDASCSYESHASRCPIGAGVRWSGQTRSHANPALVVTMAASSVQ